MISNKLMISNKHILKHAYCWKPYEKVNLLEIKKIDCKIKELKEEYFCNLSFKHTGILSTNTKLFYNASKYVNSNILIIDKFLKNKDNDRIMQVFENKETWEQDALLIKNKLYEIERSCIKLYDMFLFID
jgi:hypothetical protein